MEKVLVLNIWINKSFFLKLFSGKVNIATCELENQSRQICASENQDKTQKVEVTRNRK